MKTYRLLLSAAVLAAVACSKESEVIMPGETYVGFEFNAVAEGRGNGADSKTTISQNEGGKLQTYWVNEDAITVYSSADTDKGYTFTTSLTDKATTAGFAYEGEFTTGENYMAIYPAGERIFSFENNTISGVEVPAQQQLVPGDFDKDAAVATACSAGETTLAFKNATALVKFQVADERVVAGSVAAASGENIAGTFTAAWDSEKEMSPKLISEEGVSSVAFDIDGTTPLLMGNDYYVAVSPTTLAGGFDFTFQNAGESYIKKTYNVGSFERNNIYNVGDATKNGAVKRIELNFNFADRNAMEEWNMNSGKQTDLSQDHIFNSKFTLNGQIYTLQFMQAPDDTDNYWPYLTENTTTKYLVLQGSNRVCLPAIDGFKLVEVSIYRLAGNTTHATGITTQCEPVTASGDRSYVTGGTAKKTTKAAWNTWELTETAANTSYWIFQAGGGTNSITMTDLKLTYEKVENVTE